MIRSGQCRVDIATGRYLDVSPGWVDLYGGTREGWIVGPPHLERFGLASPASDIAREWRAWYDAAAAGVDVCRLAAVIPAGSGEPVALACHLHAWGGVMVITVTDLAASVREGAMIGTVPTVPTDGGTHGAS